MAENLNVDTSIVDYLKSKGQDSSYTSRSSLATKYGITDYAGTAEQNIKLLGLVKGESTDTIPKQTTPIINTTPTTTPIVDTSSIYAEQNAAKIKEQEDATKKTTDQTTEITDLNNQKTIAELKTSLGVGTAPAATDLTTKREDLYTTYNMSALSTQITDTQKLIADTKASLSQGLRDEEGQLRSMNAIGTRENKITKEATTRLTALTDNLAILQDQYTTNNNIISQILELEQTDYANAKSTYDTNFSNAVTLQGLVNTKEDKQQTVAQANLTVLANSYQASGKIWANMTDYEKSMVDKLATQSGYTPGTAEAIFSVAGTDDIVTTSTGLSANGTQTVSVITRDKGGNLKLSNIDTGTYAKKTGIGDGESESKLTSADRQILLGSGLTDEGIDELESYVNESGLEATLKANPDLTPSQVNALKKIYGSTLSTIDYTKSYIKEEYGDALDEAAKSAGYTKWWSFKQAPDTDKFIDEKLLPEIKKMKEAGKSDEEIKKWLES